MNSATFPVTIAWLFVTSVTTSSSETAPNPRAGTTVGADRRRPLSAFNVGDNAESFEQALERHLNRELDSMADELLTLLELDQATAMVASPMDHNSSSSATDNRRRARRATTSGGQQLPLPSADDEDQELIAVLLEKLEFGHASSAAVPPIKAEPPRRAAEIREEEGRGFCSGSNRVTFSIRGSKRNRRRHGTSRRRTPEESLRSRKPKVETRRGRVGGSAIRHQKKQRRGIAKQCSTTSNDGASARRDRHRTGPSSAIHEDPGSHGYATRATARRPQSPPANTGIGGSCRCCANNNGGRCGAEGIGSQPRQGVSFSVDPRHARGVLVTAAVLVPLSMVVTGRERTWPLALLFAPLAHALVAWVGVAVRGSDRATIDRLLGVAKIGVVALLFVAVYSFVMVVTQPMPKRWTLLMPDSM